MWCQSIGLFLCILICISFASIVNFLKTASFNLPINFKNGKIPCSKDTVVFPETLLTSVVIENDTFVNGFILPKDGDILLLSGMVVFGVDVNEDDVNCTQEGDTYYIDRPEATWSHPDIWSSPRINEATPDAERVPCFDDIVDFSSNPSFTLKLPDILQSVKALKINNSICSDDSCIYLYNTLHPERTFILNKFLNTGLIFNQESCQSKSGCPCQNNILEIDCKLKFCSVPKCIDPIKPEGHCCRICGGFMNFEINESFDITMFKEVVEKIIASYGKDRLIYHLGRLPNNKVQVVVIEKTEYSGTSAEVVNAIDHQIKYKHWVQGARLVGISGSPLDESGLGGKIFVSTFFLVVFVIGGIYVYYYKFPEISEVRFPILHQTTPAVFSRFQTRTDSVVCLTRRDSGTPIGRSTGTAFRNPLYDSTRQREEEDETSETQ